MTALHAKVTSSLDTDFCHLGEDIVPPERVWITQMLQFLNLVLPVASISIKIPRARGRKPHLGQCSFQRQNMLIVVCLQTVSTNHHCWVQGRLTMKLQRDPNSFFRSLIHFCITLPLMYLVVSLLSSCLLYPCGIFKSVPDIFVNVQLDQSLATTGLERCLPWWRS